ncbi:hypothetical protein FRB90_011153 [Tulasnella sp. 427]|nr:hypothetical protein FRB90_011153 [Tulasnella sp. 427]
MNITLEDLTLPKGTFVAPPPFDDASLGDCYLQSLEGANFKVLRHILTQSSRYFERLFEDLPSSTPDSIPRLLMDEDTQTLHALLIVLYPVHSEAPTVNTEHVLRLVEVQDKYQISEMTLMFFLTIVFGTKTKMRELVDDPLGLYAAAWRFGFVDDARYFSRLLHGKDLTDEKEASRLVRHSDNLNAYIALSDLHRRRESALDNILEALEPRKHFCSAHSASDTMFFAFLSLMKNAARAALRSPFPRVGEGQALLLLGLQSEDGTRVVTWCSSCYAGADLERLSLRLHKAVQKYPQEIVMSVLGFKLDAISA